MSGRSSNRGSGTVGSADDNGKQNNRNNNKKFPFPRRGGKSYSIGDDDDEDSTVLSEIPKLRYGRGANLTEFTRKLINYAEYRFGQSAFFLRTMKYSVPPLFEVGVQQFDE
jgi:hypothetical protein